MPLTFSEKAASQMFDKVLNTSLLFGYFFPTFVEVDFDLTLFFLMFPFDLPEHCRNIRFSDFFRGG